MSPKLNFVSVFPSSPQRILQEQLSCYLCPPHYLFSAYSSSNLRNMTTTSSRTSIPEDVVNLILHHFDSTDSEPDIGDPSWWARILSSTMNEAQEKFNVKLTKMTVVKVLIDTGRAKCKKDREKDLEDLFRDEEVTERLVIRDPDSSEK
jgi:hypothetical protein